MAHAQAHRRGSALCGHGIGWRWSYARGHGPWVAHAPAANMAGHWSEWVCRKTIGENTQIGYSLNFGEHI